jgi:hypothetical protein
MEKINASVEARCSACRDRKEKRATCGWHGMAAGEYGGGCGCLPPPRQAAGAGAYLEAAEWWGGDGEAEQTARYECTHDDGRARGPLDLAAGPPPGS